MTNKDKLQELANRLPELAERLVKPRIAKSVEDRNRIQAEDLANPPLLELARLTKELRSVVASILSGDEK